MSNFSFLILGPVLLKQGLNMCKMVLFPINEDVSISVVLLTTFRVRLFCRYTRNLVDRGNGRYNLIVLCWDSGQGSSIHDHGDSHCFMKVLLA